jgi:hypothetical protein
MATRAFVGCYNGAANGSATTTGFRISFTVDLCDTVTGQAVKYDDGVDLLWSDTPTQMQNKITDQVRIAAQVLFGLTVAQGDVTIPGLAKG